MLFGLGGAGRGARAYPGAGRHGVGATPYGPRVGGSPYGVHPNMYGPGAGPRAANPNINGAYGGGPHAGPYGGAGRYPMIF